MPAINDMKENIDNTELNTEFLQLKKELDDRYLSDFCDVIESAKNSLIEKTTAILGGEYSHLNDEAIFKRNEINSLRDKLNESDEMIKLKDELINLKEILIECKDIEEKAIIREKIGNVLKLITKKNLDNFSLMSKMKKELDKILLQLTDIANSKSDEIKSIEKIVFSESKKVVSNLAFSYRDEMDALAATFGIKDYSRELPFLKMINLDMRLKDFNKDTFISAYKGMIEHKHSHAQSHCTHDCASCHSACLDSQLSEPTKENFFASQDDNGDKN